MSHSPSPSPRPLRPRAALGSCARSLVIVVAAAGCLAGSTTAAPAQTVDPNMWVTNADVNAMVRNGGTIYIGGNFTWVGPASGNGVPVDAARGGVPPSVDRDQGS